MMDERLLEILACPACKAAVTDAGEHLVCVQCGRRYPIRDGIPVMLLEEAEQPPAQ
ncbi:MAG: Trm112 family protein [Candidatus Omnitrophica bacterium]|nr:Trm112 family protein [Candidatus Omnitrophota bacterium]